MKKFSFVIACALLALAIPGFVACPTTDPKPTQDNKNSATPTATVTTVAKTAATQKSVEFTLTSTNTGVWKVYQAASGGTADSIATAAFAAPKLTITSKTGDLAVATYFVSVTEDGKTESGRLPLVVGPYVPTPKSGKPAATVTSVNKEDTVQKFVEFTLTSANTGTWKVYSEVTGGEALDTVTATFAAPKLTLTAKGDDLEATVYYVSVTETDKLESDRLGLTVLPLGYIPPGANVTVTFGGLPSDPVTVTGGATVSKTGTLEVSITSPEEFTPFEWWLDGAKIPGQTNSSYTVNGSALTLGLHRLMVVAYKTAVPYSGELAFTVTE